MSIEPQWFGTARTTSCFKMPSKHAIDIRRGDRILNELERCSYRVNSAQKQIRGTIPYFRLTLEVAWLRRCQANRKISLGDEISITCRYDHKFLMGKKVDKLAPGGISNYERHLINNPIKAFFHFLGRLID
jgi:hypothetical protein